MCQIGKMKNIIDRKRFDLLIWPIISCQAIDYYIVFAFWKCFFVILVLAIENPISNCGIFPNCEGQQQIFNIINIKAANQHKIEHFCVQNILLGIIAQFFKDSSAVRPYIICKAPSIHLFPP